jgi:hypothetical protein
MQKTAHKQVTKKAFDLLREIDADNPLLKNQGDIIREAWRTDEYEDLEFVDVEGGWLGGSGRDDPHESSAWDDDDIAHYRYDDRNFTAFNHFMDLKKGSGKFDDYDGYSYNNGSALRDQYQDADDATDGFWEKLFASVSGMKVDEGISWWFNDEYVHAPGHPWYRSCSPAIERYSFPEDKGIYSSKEAELKERFPLASSTGQSGQGIPYSIFMPVDNLARYWFLSFKESHNPVELGSVMHAIQDASVPHHAAGYMGNWHGRYENDLDTYVESYLNDSAFQSEVKRLFDQWSIFDPFPPSHLNISDWKRTPAINWKIDQLVTWVALNAYREYDITYHHFSQGYQFNSASAKDLVKIAVAMCLLVFSKATDRNLISAEVVSFAAN